MVRVCVACEKQVQDSRKRITNTLPTISHRYLSSLFLTTISHHYLSHICTYTGLALQSSLFACTPTTILPEYQIGNVVQYVVAETRREESLLSDDLSSIPSNTAAVALAVLSEPSVGSGDQPSPVGGMEAEAAGGNAQSPGGVLGPNGLALRLLDALSASSRLVLMALDAAIEDDGANVGVIEWALQSLEQLCSRGQQQCADVAANGGATAVTKVLLLRLKSR